MKQSGKRALEKYRVFPLLAWGLIILFAFFVYDMSHKLTNVTTQLQTQSDTMDTKVNASSSARTDFDAYQDSRYGTGSN